MFFPIYDCIKNYSYGPVSVTFVDIDQYRYARIDPYNFYLINVSKEKIYLIHPGTIGCENGSIGCIVLDSTSNTRKCLNTSIPTIESILKNNPTKIVLSTDVKSFHIEDLINLAISNGVLQVT